MDIEEMMECINGIEAGQKLVIPDRITRCATNPDDSISRAYKTGCQVPVIEHPSSHFYNEFNLFSDID